jgi:hypothetical protein
LPDKRKVNFPSKPQPRLFLSAQSKIKKPQSGLEKRSAVPVSALFKKFSF